MQHKILISFLLLLTAPIHALCPDISSIQSVPVTGCQLNANVLTVQQTQYLEMILELPMETRNTIDWCSKLDELIAVIDSPDLLLIWYNTYFNFKDTLQCRYYATTMPGVQLLLTVDANALF